MVRRSGSRQVWHHHDGRVHEVAARGVLRRRVAWYVDDEQAGRAIAMRPRVTLTHRSHGRVVVSCPLIGTAQRATLDGHELTPAPGSKAERRAHVALHHPVRYVLTRIALAGIWVGAPLLCFALLLPIARRMPLPRFDLPIPDVVLPMPGWLQSTLDASDYVTPIIIAAVAAWIEIRRRRRITGAADPCPDD